MHPSLAELLTVLTDFYERTVTGEDDRGNPISTWTIKYAKVPSRIDWLGGRENRDGRELTLNTYRCFTEADITLTEGNQARQGGRTFEITAVGLFYDEDGEPDHLQMMMEKVDQPA